MGEKGWEFSWNPHHGYLTTCPSNIGTGLRAGVHLRLEFLAKVRHSRRVALNSCYYRHKLMRLAENKDVTFGLIQLLVFVSVGDGITVSVEDELKLFVFSLNILNYFA